MMRVLVACEFSGIVREAFKKRGYDAWSCDLLPSEIVGNHIQADVRRILNGLPKCNLCNQPYEIHHNCWICHKCQHLVPLSEDFTIRQKWDLMIAHPPCTYFANAGLHYLKTRPERQKQLEEAFEFIKQLWGASIPKIAIENPVGWLNTHWQKPTQIIQPYYFGEPERKTTCLWLKNLPPLITDGLYFDDIKPKGKCYRQTGDRKGKPYNYYWRQGKNGHDRSRTFQGIAQAMAEQWGNLK